MKDQKQDAKVGDTITIVRGRNISTNNITRGKCYEVTHTSYGWGGQCVTFIGDNGQYKTVNRLWWELSNK